MCEIYDTLSILVLLPSVLCAALIASRHFGEMGRLKNQLAAYSTLVERELPDSSMQVTPEQLDLIEARILIPSPTIFLNGLSKPVKIRIMSTNPPYVGADFGEGRNAIFDLTTMICTYSD